MVKGVALHARGLGFESPTCHSLPKIVLRLGHTRAHGPKSVVGYIGHVCVYFALLITPSPLSRLFRSSN